MSEFPTFVSGVVHATANATYPHHLPDNNTEPNAGHFCFLLLLFEPSRHDQQQTMQQQGVQENVVRVLSLVGEKAGVTIVSFDDVAKVFGTVTAFV